MTHALRAQHAPARGDALPVVHLQRLVGFVVALDELQHRLGAEDAAEGLVLAPEAQSHETVPLLEVDRDGVERPGFDAHHAGVHLGRRSEVVLANLEDVRGPREQLRVHREATVEGIPGGDAQAHGELALEHERGGAEQRSVGEELEDERGGDLVGDVRDAHVEVGEVHLEEVAADDGEVRGVRGALHASLKLQDHARVELHGDHLLRRLEQTHGQVTRARTDLEHHVRGLDPALLHDGVDNHGILQDVLAVRLEELDALVRRLLPSLLRLLRHAAGDANTRARHDHRDPRASRGAPRSLRGGGDKSRKKETKPPLRAPSARRAGQARRFLF